jgi:hypothetical protein
LVGEVFEVRTQVDRDLTTVSGFDRLLRVYKNLGRHSNINLGNAPNKITANISTIQTKELAKAALMETKRRLAEQAEQKEKEGESEESEMITTEIQRDLEETSVHRPPKKPPKKRGRSKVREGGAGGCSHKELLK